MKAVEVACPSVQAGMLWLFKETDKIKKVSFQFWQPDNHPELCYQLSFMWQKLEYIHKNPVRAGVVIKAEEYLHSSAADYFYGKQVGKVKVALLELYTVFYLERERLPC